MDLERDFSKVLKSNRLLSLIELGRPWNGSVTGLLSVLGVVMAVGSSFPFWESFLVFLAFMFAYFGGAALNDIFDRDVDKVNMEYRPLMEKRVSFRELVGFSFFFHVASLVIAWLVSPMVFAFVVVFLLLSVGYSVPPFNFVRRGALAQISLALITSVVPIWAGFALASGSVFLDGLHLWQVFSFSALFAFVFLLKDYKDLKGDKLGKKWTVALIMGPEPTRLLMVTGTIVFFLLSLYWFNFSVNSLVFLAASLLVLVALGLTQWRVISEPGQSFGNGRLLLLSYVILIFLGLFKFI